MDVKQNRIKDNLLCLLIDFLKNRQQRVVLNGQFSSWTKVNAGIPQGSILGPLLVLIYINDLPNGLQSNPKLFADDTSLFYTVQDVTTSTVSLNNDLTKISEWAVQWKMNFNPDPSKQAQELLFSRKISSKPYPYRLVFSRFFDICGNLGNVKEKPTRKTCFSRERKGLAPRIYQAKFCLAAFL